MHASIAKPKTNVMRSKKTVEEPIGVNFDNLDTQYQKQSARLCTTQKVAALELWCRSHAKKVVRRSPMSGTIEVLKLVGGKKGDAVGPDDKQIEAALINWFG